MNEILAFIKCYYAGEIVGADPVEPGISPIMDTVQGRLVVADRNTHQILAEFTPSGFLYYAEPKLHTSLMCDCPSLRKRDHKALEDSRWMAWDGAGGKHPPLRKQCGPWQKTGWGEWVREDYRGEACASIRESNPPDTWHWNAEEVSPADCPRQGIGYDGPDPVTAEYSTSAEHLAFYDADAWLKRHGWEFVEDGSWKPRGVLFS